MQSTKKEGRYSYYEAGEGTPIIILHGLMGGLSNFESAGAFFSKNGYKIIHNLYHFRFSNLDGDFKRSGIFYRRKLAGF
jgi:pimeloyl-ACP methyl ester carboxylesterase